MPSRSLGVDQHRLHLFHVVRDVPTSQISYVMNNEIWPLLTLVSVLHVEGKSRLEGLQRDQRALKLGIKMHVIQSKYQRAILVSARTLDQGDSE